MQHIYVAMVTNMHTVIFKNLKVVALFFELIKRLLYMQNYLKSDGLS